MLDMIVRLDPFFYEYIQVKKTSACRSCHPPKGDVFLCKKSAFLFDKERSAGKEKESENGEKKKPKKREEWNSLCDIGEKSTPVYALNRILILIYYDYYDCIF